MWNTSGPYDSSDAPYKRPPDKPGESRCHCASLIKKGALFCIAGGHPVPGADLSEIKDRHRVCICGVPFTQDEKRCSTCDRQRPPASEVK